MDLSNVPVEQLKKELERRGQKIYARPVPLDNDPAVLRQKVIDLVEGCINDFYEFKYWNEDIEHYVYECVLDEVYGEKFWDWLNNFARK